MATEIRHLQRSEVGEVQEPFRAGQKGSSAMPHKRNPIVSERITGMARLLRGYAQVGLENVALWHERDISHSSAERVILPDACLALDYMLHRFTALVEGLVVDTDRMLANLEATRGLVCSQAVLLALVEAGHDPGRCLSGGPGQRHEGMGNRRAPPRPAGGRRPGQSVGLPTRSTASTRRRFWPTPESCSIASTALELR